VTQKDVFSHMARYIEELDAELPENPDPAKDVSKGKIG
jgi:hypothetical protein